MESNSFTITSQETFFSLNARFSNDGAGIQKETTRTHESCFKDKTNISQINAHLYTSAAALAPNLGYR